MKIIYEKDKVYSKELSNLRKIDLNKRLVNDKKELISEYAQKYLTEDEKEYLSLKYGTSFQSQNNISIDFSNKELLNRVINKTEQAIINEKAQFGNFLGLLKKDMISRISKDIITSSNKKMFIEKFNKLLKDNTSKDETSKALTSVMEELYDLSSSLVLPVVKDIEIPYTFINPNEIKKTIVEDSKQETPKYPNLFNIVKFSQKLDEESAKEVTLKQLQELKNEISKMQSPSTNILSKIESLIEKMDNPITSKQEREDIKKMLKNLSLEIKKSKEDFNGNRIEIVDQITKLPGVLNAIKFENPKNYLLNMIAKLNDKDLLQQFETDLTQLSISNKDYIKQKYNKQLQESLSKEEIEELDRKNKEHPELREAHKALAREIITFLHGKEEYEKAVNLADHLFNNKFNDLSKKDIEELFKGQEVKEVELNTNIIDFVVNMGIASSKREAREFISSGAISINGEKITDLEKTIDQNMFIENTYVVVRRGKKNYYIGKAK